MLTDINSSHKDAGTTHKFSKRCIDDGHMGICADCNAAADPFDGCSICGRKGDDLSYENIVVVASQHELNKIKKADEKGKSRNVPRRYVQIITSRSCS